MISWQGHLGGLVGGTLVALGMVYAPRRQRTLVQFGVAGAVLAVALGLIVVRAHHLSENSPLRDQTVSSAEVQPRSLP
jgi:hypothetical protein